MATPEVRDPYEVLGVPRTATPAEIRAAYRALVAQYHPDRHQGNPLAALASEKMIELNIAYEALSDPTRRRFDADKPPTPDGSGAYGAADATSPRPRPPVRRNYGRIVALLALLPVIARFGALIVRGLMSLLRELAEALTLLRGTPFGAAIALAATLFLGFLLVRRLRRASAANRRKSSG